MPSSTSNSEMVNEEHESSGIETHDAVYKEELHLPYRIIPNQSWLRVNFFAGVLLIFAVVGWELLSRNMHHTAGNYQSGNESMWAEERSKLDVENKLKVVIIGSSRTLFGFDFNVINDEIGTKPLQLSIPGTGPALFVKDVVENTDFDGLLIVGVAPFLFNRMDEGYFGQGAIDAYTNQSPSDFTGAKIHDFLSDYFAFLDDAFSLPALIERYTNFPNRKGSKQLMEEIWKLGNFYEGRLTEMWEPVETVGSFDNTQMINFWKPGLRRPSPPAEKIREMAQVSIDHYAPFIKEMRARGGDIMFVRMPSSGEYLKFDLKADYYNNMWKPMIEGLDVVGLNAMDHPELSTDLDIPEWSHLSRKSQDEFSRVVFSYIDKAYLDKTGKSVYELIKLER